MWLQLCSVSFWAHMSFSVKERHVCFISESCLLKITAIILTGSVCVQRNLRQRCSDSNLTVSLIFCAHLWLYNWCCFSLLFICIYWNIFKIYIQSPFTLYESWIMAFLLISLMLTEWIVCQEINKKSFCHLLILILSQTCLGRYFEECLSGFYFVRTMKVCKTVWFSFCVWSHNRE